MEQEEDKKPPQWLMPNKVHDGLKWVGLIVCPAAATAVLGIGGAFGWQDAAAAATVITTVGTFIGACIGISATAKGGGDGGR